MIMKLRKITSLTALLSFVFMVITSIMLYIVPQGRVAYWSDWTLLGLDKTQWADIHINMGLLFLLSIGLHIYYNWKAILAYLKDKARQVRIFTPDFNAAFGLTLAILVGTLLAVPPFNWPLVFNAHLKDVGALKYGEPPYGHAELSRLDHFVRKTGLALPAAVAALREAGIRFDSEQATLQAIARQNRRSPQDLFRIMQAASASVPAQGLPADPPPGTGKKTLAALCQDYALSVAGITEALQGTGLQVSPELTLKEIGVNNGISPMAVYDAIREAVVATGTGTP
jgi:hypothetical protein